MLCQPHAMAWPLYDLASGACSAELSPPAALPPTCVQQLLYHALLVCCCCVVQRCPLGGLVNAVNVRQVLLQQLGVNQVLQDTQHAASPQHSMSNPCCLQHWSGGARALRPRFLSLAHNLAFTPKVHTVNHPIPLPCAIGNRPGVKTCVALAAPSSAYRVQLARLPMVMRVAGLQVLAQCNHIKGVCMI